MPAEIEGREDADGGENRRGKADEAMPGTMNGDVDQVCQNGSGGESGKPDAVAEELKKVVEQEDCEQAVTEQMGDVGMQCQGGEQPVVLAFIQDCGRVAGPGGKPC